MGDNGPVGRLDELRGLKVVLSGLLDEGDTGWRGVVKTAGEHLHGAGGVEVEIDEVGGLHGAL